MKLTWRKRATTIKRKFNFKIWKNGQKEQRFLVLVVQQQAIDSTESKNTALQQQLVDYQEQVDSLKDEYQQEVKVLKQQLHEANDKNQELSKKMREYEPHINRMFHLGVWSQR